ncbi:MAG: AAA family ATPase [archaeon]
MILGVTGLARCGKDTFADFLVKSYNFTKLNMSDCLRDELIATSKDPSKGNMSILGDEWRAKWGYDIVIRRTLENASKLDKVIITGFRSVEEVEFMRGNSNNFQLIAIVASDETRFSRRTPDDPQDFDTFISRDRKDIQRKGLDRVLALADHVIENDSMGWEIHEKAEEFMGELDGCL